MPSKTPGSRDHAIVTGGAGFIGSHLSRRLLEAGSRVTILTRHVEAPRALELAGAGARVVACDVSSPERIPDPDTLGPADVLYHLAADVSVSGPGLWAANVEGTVMALELAAALDVPQVVVASSIEAQGPGADHEIPLREDAPCRPVTDYGVSKARAEAVVAEWTRTHDRPALVLRIGNTYGPGSAWFLQPSLLALLGVTPLRRAWPLLGHRVFQPLYVDDLVEGMQRAASRRLTGCCNATGAQPVTVDGYLEALASLTGLGAALETTRVPLEGDVPSAEGLAPDFAYVLMGAPERPHRAYDDAALRVAIGEYQRWSLARGLAATLRWYHDCGALASLLQAVRGQLEGRACTSP